MQKSVQDPEEKVFEKGETHSVEAYSQLCTSLRSKTSVASAADSVAQRWDFERSPQKVSLWRPGLDSK